MNFVVWDVFCGMLTKSEKKKEYVRYSYTLYIVTYAFLRFLSEGSAYEISLNSIEIALYKYYYDANDLTVYCTLQK